MTNNNSIEEVAVKTFCMAPEVYQRIFIEAGEDFPDQLVEQIKQDTKINKGAETMRLLEQDPDLKKAIISTFTQNKNYILTAIERIKSQSSMFREGGKLDYLVKKFQTGGVVETEYVADIKPKGIKGWFFKETKYPRLDGNPGYFSEYITPSGDTITSVAGRWERWKRVAKKDRAPQYKTSVGSDPEYYTTNNQDYINMLDNVHSRFTYQPIVSNQEGGMLPVPDENYFGTISQGKPTNAIQRFIDNNTTIQGIKRGFRNFSNSAPGKVILSPIQSISKYGAMGAIAPGVKIVNGVKILPAAEAPIDMSHRIIGVRRPDEYLPFEETKKILGLRKWLTGKYHYQNGGKLKQ